MLSVVHAPNDLIVGLATPAGSSGVAVLRLSGDGLPECLLPMVQTSSGARVRLEQLQPRKMVLVNLLDFESGHLLDQALLVYFPQPNSFTGESQVELHTHGSPVVIKRLLHLLGRMGVRIAKPGEFSRRAFLNGKLDLSRAEALMALIHATSLQAAREAARQMQGSLAARWYDLRHGLLAALVHVEAELDFADEEIETASHALLHSQMAELLAMLQRLQRGAKTGRQWQEGLDIVIAGRPNVGKSSLFNALIERDKAIVTEIPGTTRDINEHGVEWSGVAIVLADTAGLRDSSDWVEQEGIRRAKERIAQADAVLLVFDIREGLHPAERQMAVDLGADRLLLVANKRDLWVDAKEEDRGLGAPFGEVSVSCRSGEGMDLLREMIIERFTQSPGGEEGAIILVARQREIVQHCMEHVRESMRLLQLQQSGEIIALHLRSALQVIGELVGETRYEEFLDQIFSQFCIGK
jgi:tRNA modification GTPase